MGRRLSLTPRNTNHAAGNTVTGVHPAARLPLAAGGARTGARAPYRRRQSSRKGRPKRRDAHRIASSSVAAPASDRRGRPRPCGERVASSAARSIQQYTHYSPDACVVQAKVGGPPRKLFQFCLSRDEGRERRASSSLPYSLLFDSAMDVELCLKGKVWTIDHIRVIC